MQTTPYNNQLNNVPDELTSAPRWVGFNIEWNEAKNKYDKIPKDPHTGGLASSNDAATWGTLAQVLNAGYEHAAYCLTPEDPYVVIDLDDHSHNPASEEEKQRFSDILNTFKTYTELSWNGKGYHLWVKGHIPTSVQRDNVEIYTAPHFIICTGNVVLQAPINEYSELLQRMYNQMKKPMSTAGEVASVPSHEDDDTIVARMKSASNWVREIEPLIQGRWQGDPRYPSQSEADTALFSHLLFYTKDHEQAKRLFRTSALGQRDKATKNDKYLDRTIQYILKNEPSLAINIDAIIEQSKALTKKWNEAPEVHHIETKEGDIEFPPGLVGGIAEYIYASSYRPVREIALAGALAFCAGIMGRAFNTPTHTGLNLYLILLAGTGRGKEGASSGINRIVNSVRQQVPMIDRFVGPASFASGQSIIKVLDDKNCFFSVLGEFGHTMQIMCSPKATASEQLKQQVLLNVYTKSGASEMLQSSAYADAERNTKVVQSPSLTLFGESVPDLFFDGLTEAHISGGLVSRFSLIEYRGKRVTPNSNAGAPVGSDLVDRVAAVLTHVLNAEQAGSTTVVRLTGEAAELLDAYGAECDEAINQSLGGVEVEMANRAHLKALRLACLVAAGENPFNPIVGGHAAQWAIEFTRRDVQTTMRHFLTGAMAGEDAARRNAVLTKLQQYTGKLTTAQRKKFDSTKKMYEDGVMPLRGLTNYTRQLKAFKDKPRSPAQLTRQVLDELADEAVVQMLDAATMEAKYKTRAIGILILGDKLTDVQ